MIIFKSNTVLMFEFMVFKLRVNVEMVSMLCTFEIVRKKQMLW